MSHPPICSPTLIQGAPSQIQYTLVPLVFRALGLARTIRAAELAEEEQATAARVAAAKDTTGKDTVKELTQDEGSGLGVEGGADVGGSGGGENGALKGGDGTY